MTHILFYLYKYVDLYKGNKFLTNPGLSLFQIERSECGDIVHVSGSNIAVVKLRDCKDHEIIAWIMKYFVAIPLVNLVYIAVKFLTSMEPISLVV